MNDFQHFLINLGLKGLILYSVIVIYTIILVRIVNGIINKILYYYSDERLEEEIIKKIKEKE